LKYTKNMENKKKEQFGEIGEIRSQNALYAKIVKRENGFYKI